MYLLETLFYDHSRLIFETGITALRTKVLFDMFKQLLLKISETILLLAAQRGKDKTICPSEVARKLNSDHWRPYMKEIRKIAFELRDEDKVVIMQKGNEVTGSEVVGPIRIQIK